MRTCSWQSQRAWVLRPGYPVLAPPAAHSCQRFGDTQGRHRPGPQAVCRGLRPPRAGALGHAASSALSFLTCSKVKVTTGGGAVQRVARDIRARPLQLLCGGRTENRGGPRSQKGGAADREGPGRPLPPGP